MRSLTSQYLLLSLSALLVLSGCKGSKGISTGDADKLLELEFQYLSGKAKVQYTDPGGKSTGLTAHIRIEKDQRIWILVNYAFGIEVARIQITPERVQMLNKVDKTYQEYTFAELSRKVGYDLNYPMIEGLLVGNRMVKEPTKEKLQKARSEWLLIQQLGDLEVQNRIPLTVFKIDQVNVSKKASVYRLLVDYKEFAASSDLKDQSMASQVKVSVTYPQEGQTKTSKLELDYTKVELSTEAPGFPFTVPDGYERK